jgi:hypothetical protein
VNQDKISEYLMDMRLPTHTVYPVDIARHKSAKLVPSAPGLLNPFTSGTSSTSKRFCQPILNPKSLEKQKKQFAALKDKDNSQIKKKREEL